MCLIHRKCSHPEHPPVIPEVDANLIIENEHRVHYYISDSSLHINVNLVIIRLL